LDKYIYRFIGKFRIDNLFLASCIIIYFVIGILLIQNYLYIPDTDGISYIHIAQHYINGQFNYAINGYWSPLYSWFLIPFLLIWQEKLGILFAAKLLGLLIGCFTFFGVYLCSNKLNFEFKYKALILVTLIPIILYFALTKITPDLLVLTILIFYLNFIFDTNYIKNPLMGLLTGSLGALAFLSKTYVFFFFLIHFTIVNQYYWFKFKKNRKVITKNFVLGMVVFLIISGVWIALISTKYDKITIGTSGEYNYAIFGPESSGQPVINQGLMKPHDELSMSIWDDPTYIKIKNWSPFTSIKNFDFQIQVILYDVIKIFYILEYFSILSIFIIIMVVFLIFKSSYWISKNKLNLIMVTMFIYSAGYCLIFVEARYLWFIDVLLLLTGIFSIKVLSEEYSINKTLSTILIFILCGSFVFYPVINLNNVSDSGKDTYNLSEKLKKYDIQDSNMAAGHGNWRDGLLLSYYLDTKYYGLTKPLSSENEISEELHKNNVVYYIWWSNEPIYISGYEELKYLDFDYPKIYRIIKD
jgi:hypothetical protein